MRTTVNMNFKPDVGMVREARYVAYDRFKKDSHSGPNSQLSRRLLVSLQNSGKTRSGRRPPSFTFGFCGAQLLSLLSNPYPPLDV